MAKRKPVDVHRTIGPARVGPIITKWPVPWLHSCRRYYLNDKCKIKVLRGAIVCPVRPVDKNGRRWVVRIMCEYGEYKADTQIIVRLVAIVDPERKRKEK